MIQFIPCQRRSNAQQKEHILSDTEAQSVFFYNFRYILLRYVPPHSIQKKVRISKQSFAKYESCRQKLEQKNNFFAKLQLIKEISKLKINQNKQKNSNTQLRINALIKRLSDDQYCSQIHKMLDQTSKFENFLKQCKLLNSEKNSFYNINLKQQNINQEKIKDMIQDCLIYEKYFDSLSAEKQMSIQTINKKHPKTQILKINEYNMQKNKNEQQKLTELIRIIQQLNYKLKTKILIKNMFSFQDAKYVCAKVMEQLQNNSENNNKTITFANKSPVIQFSLNQNGRRLNQNSVSNKQINFQNKEQKQTVESERIKQFLKLSKILFSEKIQSFIAQKIRVFAPQNSSQDCFLLKQILSKLLKEKQRQDKQQIEILNQQNCKRCKKYGKGLKQFVSCFENQLILYQQIDPRCFNNPEQIFKKLQQFIALAKTQFIQKKIQTKNQNKQNGESNYFQKLYKDALKTNIQLSLKQVQMQQKEHKQMQSKKALEDQCIRLKTAYEQARLNLQTSNQNLKKLQQNIGSAKKNIQIQSSLIKTNNKNSQDYTKLLNTYDSERKKNQFLEANNKQLSKIIQQLNQSVKLMSLQSKKQQSSPSKQQINKEKHLKQNEIQMANQNCKNLQNELDQIKKKLIYVQNEKKEFGQKLAFSQINLQQFKSVKQKESMELKNKQNEINLLTYKLTDIQKSFNCNKITLNKIQKEKAELQQKLRKSITTFQQFKKLQSNQIFQLQKTISLNKQQIIKLQENRQKIQQQLDNYVCKKRELFCESDYLNESATNDCPLRNNKINISKVKDTILKNISDIKNKNIKEVQLLYKCHANLPFRADLIVNRPNILVLVYTQSKIIGGYTEWPFQKKISEPLQIHSAILMSMNLAGEDLKKFPLIKQKASVATCRDTTIAFGNNDILISPKQNEISASCLGKKGNTHFQTPEMQGYEFIGVDKKRQVKFDSFEVYQIGFEDQQINKLVEGNPLLQSGLEVGSLQKSKSREKPINAETFLIQTNRVKQLQSVVEKIKQENKIFFLKYQKEAQAKNKLQQKYNLLRFGQSNAQLIHRFYRFFDGYWFRKQEEERGKIFLGETIETVIMRKIKRTVLLYRFDPKNTTDFHNYVNDIPYFIVIVRTKETIVAFYYNGAYNYKSDLKEQSVLFNVKNCRAFQKHRPEDKVLNYNEVYFQTINSQFRLKQDGQIKCCLNPQRSPLFNIGNQTTTNFMETNDIQGQKGAYFEFHQIIFEE